MKKLGRKLTAAVIALAMVCTTFMSYLPSIDVLAAETKTMAHLKAGSGNANGHFGSATPEAFALSDKADITDDDVSFQIKVGSTKAETRFRFVTKYVDDTHWAYVAYDGASGWFTEFNNGGQTGWPSLTGLPHLNQNDFVNVSMSYEADGLHITVDNTTTGESGTTVTNNENLIALKDQAGKIGFGAARFDTQLTDIYFADVVVGETTYDSYENWAVYKTGLAGQVWEPAVEVEVPGEGGGEVDPPTPPTGEGRAWYTLKGGSSNGGGHAYGDASKAAPVTLLDNDKRMADAGELSLALKPSNNWGVFYTYVDDNNWLYVGKDSSSGWYYQYKLNGAENYPKISGLPEVAEGEEMQMSISLSRETLVVTVNGKTVRVTNQALIDFAEQNAGKGRFGVKTNGQTTIKFADVTYNGTNCMEDNWVFCAERTGQVAEKTYEKLVPLTGTVTNVDGEPIEGAKVLVGLKSAVTDAAGHYTIEGLEVADHNMAVTKGGYQAYSGIVTIEDKEDNVKDVTLELKTALDLSKYDTIESGDMKVYIGKTFPVVARYEMKSDATGETFFRGNETELNAIEINGVSIEPEVTIEETTTDARTYAMHVEKDAINFDMKVKVSVKDNNLTWAVTEIKKNEGCPAIATINIPQLNLLSVDAGEEESVFAGAKASTVTTAKADTYITFDDGFVPSERDGYLYAFLSNGKLSAGLHSNSEAEGDKRVIRNNGADVMSLTSAQWYYERGDVNANKRADLATYPLSELPYAKVAIAADENKDGDIDWNDGAIAYRDIMNTPYGSEKIKDMVNYRIVMNFASMAPNPYLATADNIKKVYLATDGLPQAVMLKGYGNEGHDSANSEYADIAEREGGVEDFQDLIKIAHDYNTEIGIHVNAQECYPESKSYNESMVPSNTANGWGWLDQSHVIDKLWDVSSQARWKRFVQLYDRINNTNHLDLDWEKGQYVKDSQGTVDKSKAEIKAEAESLKDNMDFIYLDVWYQDAWETRRIAEEINSLGWRFSTEFSAEGEYDSTWQHWSTDAQYGGAAMKGYNSDIIRFIRNDQRDSQVLNHPAFGGTADNPLLGGYRLYGFEGWGGDRDYNNYIFETFNQNLPTRFLQHYQVIDWENYGKGEKSPVGNTEKQITLSNGKDKVVVTRKEKQREDTNIERTITLNGKKVLDDVTYLLPWTDNDNKEEKLYHWNLDGGTTTWQLPNGWNVENVVMYELSDQGRINKTEVPVEENGFVTLDANAATAYVVVKGEGAKALKNDFGECDYVKDPGFNGYAAGEQLSADNWTGDIKDESVVIEKSFTGDQRLAFNSPTSDVAVTTTISGLKPGTNYVAEVNVQNDSDEKASIKVDAGKTVVSNYTERSIIGNYVKCDAKNGTSMQRMQIAFTAESEIAKLTLSRAAGAGSTYMDDIRIVEKTVDNFKADGSFVQDFESVVQGLYPFVLSSAQGISDPVTHLSQLNAPYTQKGWGGKRTDDVITALEDGTEIDSQWSLKHHGRNTGIIYQTIPQNFRFEPGKTYTVEFDYQSAPNNAYAMVVGNGTSFTMPTAYLAQAQTTKHVEMTVTGEGNGQTWIGLYENGSASSDGNNNVGQNDFILDNLVITEDKDASAVVLEKTELYKGETSEIFVTNVDGITWTSSDAKVAVVEDGVVKALAAGTTTLTATYGETTKTFEVTVTDGVSVDVKAELSATANTHAGGSEPAPSGYAAAAVDGKSSTYWHSSWSGGVSSTNPAVITIDLGKDTHIGGFKFQQRPGTNNGVVWQYKYRILDADKTPLVSSDPITVSDEQRAGAKWIDTVLENNETARYIEISVLQGQGNFAAIAEVVPYFVERVAADATLANAELHVDETTTLEPTPVNGTMLKGLVWASSDEEVATVNKYGVVTALKVGTTTITVTNAAGLSAECTVTVKAYADYSKVDEALAKAEKLVEDQYTADSWAALQAAIGAVVRGKEAAEQTTVDGWATAIEAAIKALKLKDNGATDKKEYTVTVIDGSGSGSYPYNKKLTITADAKESVKFVGWEVDGKIVSTNKKYTFYVAGDVELVAKYDVVVKGKAQALMSNTTATKRSDGKFDVRFVGQLVIPEGYKLVNAGLVWSTKDTTTLTLDSGLKPTYITRISDTNQFSVTIKGLPAGYFIRGRIFATVVDKKGNQKVIYSEEKRVETKAAAK